MGAAKYQNYRIKKLNPNSLMSPNKSDISTVYIVDDDISICESLSSLIRSDGKGVAVEFFTSAQDFLENANLKSSACLILDVRMPGLDGLGLQDHLCELGKRIPIIFMSGSSEVPQVVRAIKKGAVNFLNKPFKDIDLLKAIDEALLQSAISFAEQGNLDQLCACYESLTLRERQIMAEVVKGKLNKSIASDLGVTESTVKVHRHNVMSKMNIKSVPELTLALQKLKKIYQNEFD